MRITSAQGVQQILGRFPEWNEQVWVYPAYGDQDPCVHIEVTREMFIEQQNSSEWWSNMRPEFTAEHWERIHEDDRDISNSEA